MRICADARAGERLPGPLAASTWARRRFGGYVVHLGVVLVFVAIAASQSYVSHTTATLKPGERFQLGPYTVQMSGLRTVWIRIGAGPHDVHVTAEHQPAAVWSLGSGADQEVGLVTRGGRHSSHTHAWPIEILGQELDHWQVAEMARGVEPHQAGEQIAIGERGANSQVPGSCARCARRLRTSRTLGWSSGSASFQSSTNRP